MVEDELIHEVLRHAVANADSTTNTPFQHHLVHTLLEEMAGQQPSGTSETIVRAAIREGKVSRVRRQKGLPPTR